MMNNTPLAETLNEREQEILAFLVEGLSNREIATRLHLAYRTVKWYNTQIYSKLGVNNRDDAVIRSKELGLPTPSNNIPSMETIQHNLPHQTTLFIGRQQELDDLAHLITNSDARLITILAPGGMGKTRLALAAAAQQLNNFSDGVFFVSLAPLSSPDNIVTTIGEHVDFGFYGTDSPLQQLCNYLQRKEILLILDNFEHLLDGAPLVTELLRAAPQLKVLATSREKLNLNGETVIALHSLQVPLGKTADIFNYDAVKLFIQSAQRTRPDFELRPDELDYLARICRLTAGMPLALVLAAGWLDVLTLEQITAEIQQGIDILETEQRDVPDRQRSVTATFNYSWNRLSDSDRAIFMKLSVFRGGFTAEAAQVVAGADLRELRKLVNKAFIQAQPSGRHDIHELLRQFGATQLASVPKIMVQAQDKHCAYYVDYMKHQWTALISPRQGDVLDEIESEHHNVIDAWNHAVKDKNVQFIRDMALSLWYYADSRMPRQDCFPLFAQAADALEKLDDNREAEIVRGHMLARQGWFCFGHVTPLQASNLIDQGLTLLRKVDDCPEEMVLALYAKALIVGHVLEDYEGALRAANEGLYIARDRNIIWAIGHCLFHKSGWTFKLGKIEEAKQIAELCYQSSEDIGDMWLKAICITFLLARIEIELKNYVEAAEHVQQGYQLFQELGRPWGSAMTCQFGVQLGLLTQDENKASYWLKKSLIHHQRDGRYYRDLCETLFYASRLVASQGRQEYAVEILTVIHRQNIPEGDIHDRIGAELESLQANLPPESYTAAVTRASSLDLDGIVRDLLAELGAD